MLRRKVGFGILIFLGFAAITILYLVVMSGTADVSGTVRVDSSLVSWAENPPGQEDVEMISANGYCIKGQAAHSRMLLSTKNKCKIGKVKYSFTAKEGMRHMIMVYMQMDHLTGDVGQELELKFETNIIKKGDLKRDFAITFEEIDGINSIVIKVTGDDIDSPMRFQYPISEVPDIIKL